MVRYFRTILPKASRSALLELTTERYGMLLVGLQTMSILGPYDWGARGTGSEVGGREAGDS